MPRRPQAQRGQGGDAEVGGDQGLDRDVVVGGERDLRGEPGERALPDQVGPAAVAARDPPVPGVTGQLGRRFLALPRMGRNRRHQVHRLVQQQLLAQALGEVDAAFVVTEPGAGRTRRRTRPRAGLLSGNPRAVRARRVRGVPEHHRHVHVPGAQHAQRLRRFGLGQPQVDAGLALAEHGRGGRHDGAERGRERRQPEPPGAQPGVGGQLVLGRVQPADHLGGPLGEQPSGVGEPDPAARPLDQLGPGLGFQPG